MATHILLFLDGEGGSETGPHCIAHDGLKLAIFLLQPLKCWDYRMAPPLTEVYIYFLRTFYYLFLYRINQGLSKFKYFSMMPWQDQD
jgi:hypothetical protein